MQRERKRTLLERQRVDILRRVHEIVNLVDNALFDFVCHLVFIKLFVLGLFFLLLLKLIQSCQSPMYRSQKKCVTKKAASSYIVHGSFRLARDGLLVFFFVIGVGLNGFF